MAGPYGHHVLLETAWFCLKILGSPEVLRFRSQVEIF